MNWKSIPSWEGFYEVSDLGEIRSVARTGYLPHKKGRIYGGGPIAQLTKTNGYRCVNLTRDGVRVQMHVHRAVLLAFCGPAAADQEACHNNGDRTDNSLANLRWDTRKANHADKWKHGTQQTGDRNGNSRAMRALRAAR